MELVSVNWWAVIVSTVISMVLGAGWYSMALFGKPWMKAIGKSEADLKGGAGTGYAIAVVSAFVTAYILAHFVHYTNAQTVATGAVTGFWLWLGFIFGPMAMNQSFEGRPASLLWINAGMQLVNLLIIGAILAVWR